MAIWIIFFNSKNNFRFIKTLSTGYFESGSTYVILFSHKILYIICSECNEWIYVCATLGFIGLSFPKQRHLVANCTKMLNKICRAGSTVHGIRQFIAKVRETGFICDAPKCVRTERIPGYIKNVAQFVRENSSISTRHRFQELNIHAPVSVDFYEKISVWRLKKFNYEMVMSISLQEAANWPRLTSQ